MYQKYRKAVAVTPHDTNELSSPADAIYIGSGDWTSAVDFAGGVGGIQLASDAGTAEHWWRADDSFTDRGTLFLDNNGTGGGDKNAEFKSGGGVAVPSIVQDDAGIKNKPYVSFPGDDSYLQVGDHSSLDFDGDFSVVLLMKWDSLGSYETIMAKDYVNSEWQFYKTNTNTITGGSIGAEPVSPAIVANQWYVVEWSRSGSTQNIYLDGIAGTSSSNSTDMSGTDHLFIGKRNDATELPLDGGIAEILIWGGSTLSASDRDNIVEYFQDKYTGPSKVDVKLKTDTGTEIYKRLETGVIHPIKTLQVFDTSTNGSDIVALYEN